MKRNIKIGTCVLLIAFLLLSTAIVPAMGSNADKQLTNENEIMYTKAELQEMYTKYGITDNDIKFANRELPNFLEGTILYGDQKVLVTEDGKPLDGMEKGVDYDILMTEAEMFKIIEEAENEYIQKYGVDPSNPKIDNINGQAIDRKSVV